MTQVSVAGAGRMGAGIGLCFARHGARVTYLVRDERRAASAVGAWIDELSSYGDPVWPAGTQADVDFRTAVEDLPDSDLVVESVPEDLALKVSLLGRLSRAQPAAVICSNTSSLRITDLSAEMRDPGRLAGMHFWYPPPLMPLVELVPGDATSADTLDAAERLLRDVGKTPVRLRSDYPGFLWNRLQVAMLREAKALVESGVATARDVDLVVELGLARRWSLTGPLATAVLGGLETFEAVGRNLSPLLSSARDLDGLRSLLAGYVGDPAALDRWRNERLVERDRCPQGRPEPPARG